MQHIRTKEIVYFLSVSLFILSVLSCKENKKRTTAENTVAGWVGKEIKFPANAQCCVLGKDTVSTLCSDLFQKEYKLLMYIDSAGCSDCRLKLFEWKRLITEADSLFQDKLGFVFFFQPKNKKEMSHLFKRDNFDYPVFVDMDNSIERLNHFPSQDLYRCFLLDKRNKVVMIGNSVLNPKIWDLYRQRILSNKSQ